MKQELVMKKKCFAGTLEAYKHSSEVLDCGMEWAIFRPETPSGAVLWYLSGLTCTWKNVMEKGAFFEHCARRGVTLIAPDTSPRGENVADDSGYDLGQGAGFYLNATQAPWSKNFFMEDYITKELPEIVFSEFSDLNRERQGITGHSMGGHGALVHALKRPETFRSVSAFSPICRPTAVPWGKKAFTAYLGEDQATWKAYDACELVSEKGWKSDILIDQGSADEFLEEQLAPESFAQACQKAGVTLSLRHQEGYDHSYYFISSFAKDHVDWHADRL